MGKKSKRRAKKSGARSTTSTSSSAAFRGAGPSNSSAAGGNGAAGLPSSLAETGGFSRICVDEFDRTFCAEHKRDFCHVCCMDCRDPNRIAEERAGLRKKRTPVEEAADEYAFALRALSGMERMHPRPPEELFEQNRQRKKQAAEKLERFADAGEDVEEATRRTNDKEATLDLEVEALTREIERLHPGQTQFGLDGPESQKIYDELIKGPQGKETRADVHTCSYCGKTSADLLRACSRCKKASYCSPECQQAAWPAHKKYCVAAKKEPNFQHLTWEQVEAHGGAPAVGETLEVKAIKDESLEAHGGAPAVGEFLEVKAIKEDEGLMRQVFQCRDRVDVCRRIVAYTNSRQIPGLRVGATLKWTNPRFHDFVDGSSGARIEEEDLENIKVS